MQLPAEDFFLLARAHEFPNIPRCRRLKTCGQLKWPRCKLCNFLENCHGATSATGAVQLARIRGMVKVDVEDVVRYYFQGRLEWD